MQIVDIADDVVGDFGAAFAEGFEHREQGGAQVVMHAEFLQHGEDEGQRREEADEGDEHQAHGAQGKLAASQVASDRRQDLQAAPRNPD